MLLTLMIRKEERLARKLLKCDFVFKLKVLLISIVTNHSVKELRY